MTIAQQLKVTEFPFVIKDSRGKEIYYEDLKGYWSKREYDSNNNQIYFENSRGEIIDKRPKPNHVVDANEMIELPQQDVNKFEKFLDNEIELGLSPKDTVKRIKWYYQTYFKSKETLYTDEQVRMAIQKSRITNTKNVLGTGLKLHKYTDDEIIELIKTT